MPLTPLLYDLSLLYLALAYGADAHLDEVELNAMREQLEAWAPGLDPARLDHILNEAMLGYVNGLDEEHFDELLDRLRDVLSPNARRRVIEDLRRLAHADERLESAEIALIERVERTWEPG